MIEGLSLEHLRKPNQKIVKELYSADFSERSANDELATVEVIEANHALAESLYGSEVARLVREQKFNELNEIHRSNLERLAASEAILDEVDLDELGVIVVRPEIIEAVQQCIALVEENSLRIIYDKPLEIDFARYWALYHHGLLDPDSYYDFPTRTLNYANKSCHLLILGRSDSSPQSLPVSDLLTQELKGQQGSYARNTLRGDIAFTALSEFADANTNTLVNNSAIALDPIGAYRHLVRGTIPSDETHLSADNPLLFYAGQGVHIPNSEEISQDLRILCSQPEIEDLIATAGLPMRK